jgi:hypothetical protein
MAHRENWTDKILEINANIPDAQDEQVRVRHAIDDKQPGLQSGTLHITAI